MINGIKNKSGALIFLASVQCFGKFLFLVESPVADVPSSVSKIFNKELRHLLMFINRQDSKDKAKNKTKHTATPRCDGTTRQAWHHNIRGESPNSLTITVHKNYIYCEEEPFQTLDAPQMWLVRKLEASV